MMKTSYRNNLQQAIPKSSPGVLLKNFAGTVCLFALSLGVAADDHETKAKAASQHQGEKIDQVMTLTGPLGVYKLASLKFPWGMEPLGNGDLLITEKPGMLRIYSAQGKLSDPIEGVPEVAYRNQGGLLDVAVDPNFDRNGMIYLYTVQAADEQPKNPMIPGDPRLGPYIDQEDTTKKGGVVYRARLRDGKLSKVEEIWRQTPFTIGLGHFGGRLQFLPDGALAITSGERQRFNVAQSKDTNLGKIVRIKPDGSIPKDNPYSSEKGPMAAVWSMGHRNPLGAAINPESGELWMHEMGPLHGDEINIPKAGKNYGWPDVSNGENYDRSNIDHHEIAKFRYAQPAYYWRPAISPSGMSFYSGEMFSDWQGDLLIGGLSSQALIRLELDGDKVSKEERINFHRRIRDVMSGSDGAIYLLTDYEDGALLRVVPGEGFGKNES